MHLTEQYLNVKGPYRVQAPVPRAEGERNILSLCRSVYVGGGGGVEGGRIRLCCKVLVK